MPTKGKYDRFEFRPDQLKSIGVKRRAKRPKKLHAPDVRFVKGTMPFSLLGQAFKLHPAAPLVLLAIKSEADIQYWRGNDDPEVAVTSKLCSQLNLTRDQRLRALRALEAAGLISVAWASRRAPRVRVAPGLFDEGKITVVEP